MIPSNVETGRTLNKIKKGVIILLVLIMVFSALPSITGIMPAKTWAADPAWDPGPGEVLVTSQAELNTALTGNTYHTIYLGADITQPAVNLNGTSRPNLTINGTNPRTDITHTLTMTAPMQVRTTGRITDLTFKNIRLRQPTQTTGIVTAQAVATSNGVTVTFENTDIEVYRNILAANMELSAVKIIDSYIASTNPNTARLFYTGSVEFFGEVTINAASGGYGIFQINQASAPGTFTVTNGADVRITSTGGQTQASLFNALGRVIMNIEENANFSYTGGNLGYSYAAANTARSILVDRNAYVLINLRGNRSRLRTASLTVNEGASLYLWASTSYATNYRQAVYCPTMNLNSPFRVVFATGGTANNTLFLPNTNFNAKNIKSIRYFTSGTGSFDGMMNYVGANRADYRNWWFQQNGLYNTSASNWSSISTTYNPTANIVPGATLNFDSTNFNPAAIHAVQIDGGSRAPTIDTVYVGASSITGTGQPGADVTVTWPTTTTSGPSATPATTVRVEADGTWRADVPEDIFLEISDERPASQIMATQRETLYGLDRGESHQVYAPILGTAMKLIGNNGRNLYYNHDTIPDTAEILFFGSGLTIDLEEFQGRYILTNSTVSDPGNAAAFETLWTTTTNPLLKGYIEPHNATFWREDLCDIPANCTVWAMADIKMGGSETTTTVFDLLVYNNLFERREISLRLLEGLYTDLPGSHTEISPYTPIPGNYGIPYNLNGNIHTGPAVRYSRVSLALSPYMADYWTATTKLGTETPVTITLDSSFPTNYLGISDDGAGLTYTLFIQKVLYLWREVPMAYVDKEGDPIPDSTGEPASIWVPMDIMEDLKEYGEEEEPDPPQPDITSSDFLLRGGRYIPQKHYPFTPIGYYVSQTALDVRDEPEGDPSLLNICSDFSKDFNPEITNIDLFPPEIFYIVFDEGITDVREVHKFKDDLGGDSIYPDRISVAKIESDKPPVRYTAPRISGYVPVGWEIRNLIEPYNGEFVYNPANPEHFATMDQNGHVFVDLTSEMIAVGFDPFAPEELEIVWLYAIDANNDGIPDEEETRIHAYWYGMYPDISFPAQLNSTVFATRIGYEFTISNDGSETGNPGHKIVLETGFNAGVWIFDPEVSENFVIASLTPLDSSPQTIEFWYAYSSDGERPDNKQYVDVYYILWDDDEGNGATEPEFLERKYALKGDILNYAPGDMAGYIYYGYQTDYEEDEGLVFSDYVNGMPPAEIAFFMNEYTHELTLILIKAGEPVTIYWKGSTLSGNVVTIAQKELTGYWGESVTVERSDVPTESFWVPLEIESSSETFVLNTTPGREHTFNFNERRTSITITVEGVGPLSYSYQLTIPYPAPTQTINALEGFHGYKVIAYEVHDRFGFEITPYTPGNSIVVDPLMGEQTVTFHYVSTITTLTIKAVEKDNPGNVLLEKVITDLSIGQVYAAIAPFIDETWVLDGDVIRPISIAEGANEAVFEYEQASGNLTVILREVESPGVPVDPENNIKVVSAEYAADGVFAVPDLAADYYTAVDTGDIPITYSELPDLIYVDYTKDLINVNIVPVDQSGGIPIPGADSPAPPARKGEMFTATAFSVTGYTLMEAGSKEVYADPLTDPVEVEFEYKQDVTGKVTINHYYLEGFTKIYLSESMIEVPEGTKLTIRASDYAYPGFLFGNKIYLGTPAVEYSGAEAEFIVSRVDADNLLEFLYTDIRKAVNVYNKLGSNPVVEITGSPLRFVEGEPAIIHPSYLEGYVLVGYAIDPDNLSAIAETEVVEIESSFTGVDLGGIAADHVVVFIYVTEEEYFNSRISTITIEGRQGSTLLYSYNRPVIRSNTEATLTVPEDVFEIPGFVLEGGQDYTFIPNRDKTLRFNYLSLASAVRIRMVDGADNDIIPGFFVAATTGGILSYNAPNLPGYYLTDTQGIQIADPVLADGESELLFHYAPLSPSSVTIIAKENDTFGRIIRIVEVPTPTSGTHDYPSPDLSADFYTVIPGSEDVSIDWDGMTSASGEAYYTKDLVSIAVNKVDFLTSAPIEAPGSVAGQRQGEAATIAAPTLTGYVLIGSATQTVVADSGAQATFSYRTLASNEVQVTAVDKGTGAVLQNYVLSGTAGETLSVRAPFILGWILDGAAFQDAVIGTDQEVVFEYDKDVATITVHKIHLTGLAEIGLPQEIEVARGGNISVYAPHIEGYVIVGYDSLTRNGITADEDVYFYYKTVSEAEAEIYANITIRGINSGGVQLYRYTKRIEKSLLPYTLIDGIDIFALPGYTLDPDQEHEIMGSGSYTFSYTSTDGTVRITLLDEDSGNPVGAGSFNAAATIGQPFSYHAPHVSGYKLVSTSSIGLIPQVMPGGSSEIVFKYTPISSMVIIVCKEENSSGRIIRVIEVEDPVLNTPTSIASPDLSAEFYTPKQGFVNYTFDGSDALELEALYSKDLVDIPIIAVDDLTAATTPPLGVQPSLLDQRMGEVTTVTAPLISGYSLIGSNSRLVIALGDSEEFRYRSTEAGAVIVNVYAGSKTGPIIQSYTIPATSGEMVVINPATISIAGYSYDPGHPDNRLNWQSGDPGSGDGDDIRVIMTDNRATLNILTKLGSDAPTTVSSELLATPYTKTVYAPYVSGWVVTGYQIGSNIPVMTGTVTAAALSAVTADPTNVTFFYITEEEYIGERFITLTIEGRHGSSVLYRYSKLVEVSDTDLTLAVPEDVFEVPGFVLEDGQTYTFVPDRNKTLRFNYVTLVTTVRIRMVDGADEDIVPGFNVAAATGSILTYNAPNLPGHYLTDSKSIKGVEPVLANGASEILFHYAPITSLVTIVAKENDTSGRIIRIVEVTTPASGIHDYPAPDLSADFYTVIPGSEDVSIDWDGASAASGEAYYTKDLVSITVNKIDSTTSLPIEAAETAADLRRGEAVTITAPTITGYALVGSDKQTVVAESGAEITFSYRTLAADEVQVKAVERGTGAVLQSYVLAGTVGEILSVRAPAILGWILDDSGSKNALIGTDQEVVFEYRQDLATITIHKIHLYSSAEIGSPLTVETARGGSVTIYAPHLEGYVIDGYDSLSKDAVATDEDVYFYYKTLSEAEAESYVNITIRGENSGGAQLYSYTKRIAKTDLPYTLAGGTDIFAVPGYTLDPDQEHEVAAEGVYTFTYSSTDGTVKITLLDADSGGLVGAGSFNAAATIGQPFSYHAPDVSGYKLLSASSIGLVTKVLAGGLSEIIFEYTPISSMVIIVCKEETSERIIRVVEVEDPAISTPTVIPAPDLSAEFYTPILGSLSYTFNGIDAEELVAYYSKDLIDIPIMAVNDLTDDTTPPLGSQIPLTGQRRGEVTTAVAPMIAGFAVTGANSRLVIATGAEVEFRYRSTTITGVTVNVYAGSKAGPIIQSYIVPAAADEIIAIDPATISIAGYSYNAGHPDNRLSWRSGDPDLGDGDDIRVIMTDNRAALNIRTKLGSAGPVTVSSELLATPYSKTVYAPYVSGWIVTGYQIDSETPVMTGTVTAVTLSAITANPTNVTFFYITEEEYIGDRFITLTIEGRSGSTVLYRYSKLVGVSDTEITLAVPQDIFEVPGFILEEGQTYTFVPDRNRTLRFNYVSLATTVRIRMTDETDTDIVPGFEVAATTGSILTYNAPNLAGYYLTGPSSIGIADPVLADGESEILFHYAALTPSSVTIVAKESPDGRIIKIIEIPTPTTGLHTYPAPDLSADFYTVVPGYENVGIDWNGFTAASGEVYYTKDLVSVAVNKIDSGTAAPIEAPGSADDLRRGEAATISAPYLAEYVLIGSPNQTVVADSGSEVTFTYRSQTEDEVQVRAVVRGTGETLQNYVLAGTVGEILVVRAPSVLGWTLIGANSQNARIGTDREVTFEYDRDALTITVHKIHLLSSAEIGSPLTAEVARGGNITIYAPHVEGHVLIGYGSHDLIGVIDDDHVYFFYKTLAEVDMENFANITIRGINSSGMQLYRYTKRIDRDDLPYELIDGIDIFAVPGYTLDPDQEHLIEEAGTYTFSYTSTDGTVTITLKDADSGGLVGAGSFNAAATIGQPFSYHAPHVSGYKLVTPSSIGLVEKVLASGLSEIVFEYTPITGKVTIIYKEDGPGGRIIRMVEVEDPVTGASTDVPTPDLTEEFYTKKQDHVTYYFDGSDAVEVEAYYEKILVDIPIMAVNDLTAATTPPLGAQPPLTGQRKGEVTTVTAPIIEGYLLVGSNNRLVLALDDAEEFRYRSTLAEDVIVNIHAGSKSGPLIQSYLIPALSGEMVVIDPATISIAGYSYAAGHPDNRLSWRSGDPGSGDGAGIRVIMTDNRATLNIRTKLGAAAATTFSSELLATPYSKTVHAPYVNGWMVTGYQIGSSAPVTTGNVTAATLTAITADPTNVTFFYITEEEYFRDRFIDLTIEGRYGGAILYSYSKLFARNFAEAALTVPQDVFEVPGFILEEGQTYTFVPDRDQTLSFNYLSLATTVRIRMVNDSDADIIPGFDVAATTGSILTYNAPNLPGYYLTDPGSIGTVDPVLANGASELLFHYAPIISPVTIVAKENDTNGRIIKIAEVEDPAPGTHTYPAPDLSGDFYTPLASPNQVSIDWDGINAAGAEAYYTKDLVSITVNKIDYLSLDPIEEPGIVDDLRQGEAVTIAAPSLTGYVLIGSANQTVVADAGGEVTFSYRTLARNEVQVKAVEKGTGAVLQSFVLTGTVGGTITVKAPVILGWALDGADTQEALIGTDLEVTFEYEKDVAIITVYTVHATSSADIIPPARIEVAKGGDITISAPHITGYVLVSDSSKTLTGIVANDSVYFLYRTITEVAPEHFVTLTVVGKSGPTELYRYQRIYPKNSGEVEVYAFNVRGYILKDPLSITVDIQENSNLIEFNYESRATTVRIRMVQEGNPLNEVATAFDVGAEVGSPFTYNAPDVAGYYLTSSSTIGIVDPVAAGGESEIIFEYARITSMLTIVAKENDPNGRVIKIVEIADPVAGLHDYEAPDLSADFYTPLADPNVVSINWDGINSRFEEAYYSKDLVDIEINKEHFVTSAPIGTPEYLRDQRKGEAVTVSAPDVTDMALVGNSTETVIADGSAVTFIYRDIASDEVVIKAVDKANNVILLSYSMSGAIGNQITVYAPTMLGWALSTDEDSSKSAVIGARKEIRFNYEKNVVMVTINIVRASGGEAIIPATVVEVPKGGNYIAYAPHITGHMLAEGTKDKEIFTNLAADAEVTFKYSVPLTELVSVIMYYLNTATNETIKIGDPITNIFFVGQHFDSAQFALATQQTTFDANGRRWELDPNKTTRTTLVTGTNEVNVYYTDKGPIPPGGGGVTKTPATLIVRAKDVKSGDYIYEQSLPVYVGDSHTVNAPVIEGYTLDASSSPSQTIIITSAEQVLVFNYNYTGSAVGWPNVSDKIREVLEVDDHIAYISGYPDKTIRPNGNITRAEVAVIFWRLLKTSAKNDPVSGSFNDVKSGVWYTQAINYLADMGILRGYLNGSYKPSQTITRAEFTAVVSRFDDFVSGVNNPFSDVKTSHWAYDTILSSYSKGWVNGYPSGVFLPGNKLTRTEAVTIINRMLGRILKKENVPQSLYNIYPDLSTTHWGFADMIEASVGHEYEWENESEIWTSWE